LFLTEAYSKNINLFKPVITWFKENLQIIRPDSKYRSLTLRAHAERNFVDYLSNFLRLKTEHFRTDGSTVNFDPAEKSDGTRRLLAEYPPKFRESNLIRFIINIE